MEKKWYLDRVNIFEELSEQDRLFFIKNSIKKSCAKGYHIFSAEESGDNVYLIQEGAVKIYDLAESGKESIFWFRYAGEFFGLADALAGQSRTCFAEAVEPSTILVVRREVFEEMLERNPRLALITIKILSSRLRRLGEDLKALHSQDLKGRLAQLLLNLGSVCGTERSGRISIEKKFTHQDLADMIGATRQRVTETLNEFSREGLIQVAEKTISLLDPDRLSEKTRSSG